MSSPRLRQAIFSESKRKRAGCNELEYGMCISRHWKRQRRGGWRGFTCQCVDLMRFAGWAIQVSHEFCQAPDAVAAHLRLAAVRVEDAHAIRWPAAPTGAVAVGHGKYHLHH